MFVTSRSRGLLARGVSGWSLPGRGNAVASAQVAGVRRLRTSAAARCALKIWDSRQRKQVPFEPLPQPHEHPAAEFQPEGFLGPWLAGLPAVSWYMCGPTVYDHSHIGHARTYVSFDIIRRIMTELAGHQVVVAMGVTDVDDKIIRRANESGKPPHLLAQEFELSFKQDMEQLNVMPPNTYLRVSDRVQAIVDYIESILERGYAYEPETAQGDIYFDTQAFQASGVHRYGRLARSEHDTSADQVPQEGIQASVKKHPADFALWKSAKPEEPFWDSPWGPGRPGWHIECSAAASGIFGSQLTIHSGGIDLQFPHHNNEIAQTEAFYDQPQWTQYWLHTGHLHIKGHKMSKSLKNFITIRDFLAEHSAHTFRMFCLTSGYRSNVDFAEDRLEECRQFISTFQNFVGMVDFRTQMAKAQLDWISGDANWTAAETSLQRMLLHTDAAVRAACLDDFNTAKAVASLRSLVHTANSYMSSNAESEINRGQHLLEHVSLMVQRYFRIFGFPESALRPGAGGQTGESVAQDLAHGWVGFRSQVRQLAISSAKQFKKISPEEAQKLGKDMSQQLLQQCDVARDQKMPELGLTLQDLPGGNTKWQLDPPKSVAVHEVDSQL